jgi:ABC-type transport system involved in cytochrome c biogenesis ATPase subunit
MSTPSPRARIRRLRVEQIFGPGSHDIDISFKLDERVTVLHGRNGSGKTITLRLLQALQAGRYAELMVMPFKRLVVELEDGTGLEFERPIGYELGGEGELGQLIATLLLVSAEGALEHQVVSVFKHRSLLLSVADLRDLRREYSIGFSIDGQPIDAETDAVLSYDEVRARAGDSDAHLIFGVTPESSALQAFRERLPSVKLIPADRLVYRVAPGDDEDDSPRHKHHSLVLMVDYLARQIRAVVQEADEKYRLHAIQLDATLPKRLFGSGRVPPDIEVLHRRGAELDAQEARLRALGLLKEPASEPSRVMLSDVELSDVERTMFSIILDDRAAKLEPFANIVNKAERLLTSLNQKLSPKQVKLDVTKGYEVLTAGGAPLPLSKLSSGEQHELVLLHELLFSVEPGTLVLLDEPELSLHVTWQETLLEELIDVAALTGAQFVLATHSPYIIGERTDLMVRLGDPA